MRFLASIDPLKMMTRHVKKMNKLLEIKISFRDLNSKFSKFFDGCFVCHILIDMVPSVTMMFIPAFSRTPMKPSYLLPRARARRERERERKREREKERERERERKGAREKERERARDLGTTRASG